MQALYQIGVFDPEAFHPDDTILGTIISKREYDKFTDYFPDTLWTVLHWFTQRLLYVLAYYILIVSSIGVGITALVTSGAAIYYLYKAVKMLKNRKISPELPLFQKRAAA